MYNTTSKGLRRHSLAAVVDGVVASVDQALADAAPGRLVLTRGELHDASVNRSPQAFARNPQQDRQHFPAGIDPASTLLRLERDGRVVGVVNWFATHGTSLTNRNRLISGDNKGYAARAWEQVAPGGLVAAFAQTNAGDMSPNVPNATQGPTDDEVENTRFMGNRSAGPPRLTRQKPSPADDPERSACRVAAPSLAGGVVSVEVHGDEPRGPARPSYFTVERQDGDAWVAVADHADRSTTVRWRRESDGGFHATVSWQAPSGAAGTFGLVWLDGQGQAHRSAPLPLPA